MNPLSILMFCFSGALCLYAILLAITKDYDMIPRGNSAKVENRKDYAFRFAQIIALVAIPPAHCGFVALFSPLWGLAVLLVEMVLVIWAGTKLMDER